MQILNTNVYDMLSKYAISKKEYLRMHDRLLMKDELPKVDSKNQIGVSCPCREIFYAYTYK